MDKIKTIFFKDPVQREINFSEPDRWLIDLIKTPEFQRLKRIKQLGVSDCIFPSATHTRFSHSLGTYEVSRKFIENLGIKNIDQYKRKILLVAALLHDIGHGPNSHAFEKYTGLSHEIYTKKIILESSTNIYKILVKNNVKPVDVINILEKKSGYPWMEYLVSSQIDADRIDYLLRDSHYTGAAYGVIDVELITKRIILDKNQIVFSSKAISAIENFLLGRYHMYTQVYENHHAIANEWIIKTILKRVKDLYLLKFAFVDKYNLMFLIMPWLENKMWDLNLFFQLDDDIFHTLLVSFKYENDYILKNLVDSMDKMEAFDAIEYDKKIYELYLKKLKKANLTADYNTEIIDLKSTYLYTPLKQPIYIYDENLRVITTIDKCSALIKNQQEFVRKRKLMIVNNSIMK